MNRLDRIIFRAFAEAETDPMGWTPDEVYDWLSENAMVKRGRRPRTPLGRSRLMPTKQQVHYMLRRGGYVIVDGRWVRA